MHGTRREGLLLALSALVALLAGSASCGHTRGAVPAPVATPPQPAAAAPEPMEARAARSERVPTKVPELPASAKIGDVMLDHFLITSWARDAVIAGLLEPMKGPLNALADYRYDGIPVAGWAPQLAQLQAAARLTSTAATLETAAMGVATMARMCGECHMEKHAGPVIPPVPESNETARPDSVPERMDRHMWATELLWEGLTGPSDKVWKAGADMLVRAPERLDQELPAAFDADLREIRGLGEQARGASTLEERADVMGLLIATCADCHTRWIEDEEVRD
jgi:cytochrome c553